ncbi:MAG: cupin domain-containing protein [Gaiellaceae bacterium]
MDVTSPDRVDAYVTKDGSTIRELHHTALQSLAEATLEPGQATERHYHAASEEIYVVTKGSGSMEIEGEVRRVAKGDAVLIPARARHALENNGTSELVFLCCCAPPYSHDDTDLIE